MTSRHGYNLRPRPRSRPCRFLLGNMPPKAPKTKIPKKKDWKASDFTGIRKLGEGRYGKVYFVILQQTGQMLAVKMLKEQRVENTKEKDIVEARILKKASHPNVLKCYAVFVHNGFFSLLLEFCVLGDLWDYVYKRMHSIGESQAVIGQKVKCIVRQIVSGIDHVQNKLGYIHMDIRLCNILISDDRTVKVTDFGCAVRMGSPRLKHYKNEYEGGAGHEFSPLELLKRRGYFFDSTADVWAIGCLTYEMLTRRSPFFNSYRDTCQLKLNVKNAMRVIRDVHRGKFQQKFTDRLGPHQHVLTFLRHIFVPRTCRPLVKNLLELDWLN